MATCLLINCLTAISLICHVVRVNGITLAPVYWNASNPIFKASKNDHIIDVNPFDEIDFICPSFTTHTAEASLEYYLIHRVSRDDYEACSMISEMESLLILNCSLPLTKRRFTILFEPYQSIPNAPEYKQGTTYYFITTSGGRKHDLSNLYHGACLHNNMKLKIRVSKNFVDDTVRDNIYDHKEVINTRKSTISTTIFPRHTRRHHHTKFQHTATNSHKNKDIFISSFRRHTSTWPRQTTMPPLLDPPYRRTPPPKIYHNLSKLEESRKQQQIPETKHDNSKRIPLYSSIVSSSSFAPKMTTYLLYLFIFMAVYNMGELRFTNLVL